jgi:hypothetical protein
MDCQSAIFPENANKIHLVAMHRQIVQFQPPSSLLQSTNFIHIIVFIYGNSILL